MLAWFGLGVLGAYIANCNDGNVGCGFMILCILLGPIGFVMGMSVPFNWFDN